MIDNDSDVHKIPEINNLRPAEREDHKRVPKLTPEKVRLPGLDIGGGEDERARDGAAIFSEANV
jgi:hypothetical protein